MDVLEAWILGQPRARSVAFGGSHVRSLMDCWPLCEHMGRTQDDGVVARVYDEDGHVADILNEDLVPEFRACSWFRVEEVSG